MCILKNSLNQSHQIVSSIVEKGDLVIDATAGNGNDTVFLAGLIGKEGSVYSFDIQQSALNATQQKLMEKQLDDKVRLIHDGHQNIKNYISEPVKAVMFNLGYLPGGDHSIGTKGNTTIEAIKASMELLAVHGIISIVVYYGGDSGFDEKNEVMDFIKTIDCKKFTVMRMDFVNQINCPPILICIEKTKE
ncbi:MAG: putative rRNA methylase [Eubacterium sp.]|jgi:tRNA1(Val) A37 N6-methylase TrmN6|nr:putative rRNA methylase [Eubacterium sp.]